MRPRTRNKAVISGYNRGVAAYRLGLPITACAYPSNAIYKKSWEDGWIEAQRKDKRSTARLRRELENIRKTT